MRVEARLPKYRCVVVDMLLQWNASLVLDLLELLIPKMLMEARKTNLGLRSRFILQAIWLLLGGRVDRGRMRRKSCVVPILALPSKNGRAPGPRRPYLQNVAIVILVGESSSRAQMIYMMLLFFLQSQYICEETISSP